jgi:hypothetical protein
MVNFFIILFMFLLSNIRVEVKKNGQIAYF